MRTNPMTFIAMPINMLRFLLVMMMPLSAIPYKVSNNRKIIRKFQALAMVSVIAC